MVPPAERGRASGMTTERNEFPWLVRLRRRGQGRTQEDLARCAGITKGALSRYESGDTRVLGDATLRKLCAALAVDVPDWLVEEAAGASLGAIAEGGQAAPTARYFCPTPFCRMNSWFAVPGWVHFVPQFVGSVAGAEVVCQFCGATLQSTCPQCEAPLGQHGVCPACGADYVPRLPEEAARRLLEMNAAASPVAAPPVARLPFWQPLRRDSAKVVAGPGAGGSNRARD
jgi:transcriptional regulator with XRE-family HTH domain